jgi:5-methylcytosine-specific restriction endonuclease McrA
MGATSRKGIPRDATGPDFFLRQAAMDAGQKRYQSIVPCSQGHIERWVANGTCVECCRAQQRTYMRQRDPEERARAQRNYLAKPGKRELHQSHIRNRRAKERQAEGSHTGADIQYLLEAQNHCCKTCGCCVKDGFEVDHIVPVAKGGSNWPSNLQILCQTCNRRKGVKNAEDFARFLNGGR